MWPVGDLRELTSSALGQVCWSSWVVADREYHIAYHARNLLRLCPISSPQRWSNFWHAPVSPVSKDFWESPHYATLVSSTPQIPKLEAGLALQSLQHSPYLFDSRPNESHVGTHVQYNQLGHQQLCALFGSLVKRARYSHHSCRARSDQNTVVNGNCREDQTHR